MVFKCFFYPTFAFGCVVQSIDLLAPLTGYSPDTYNSQHNKILPDKSEHTFSITHLQIFS